jgi:hypothetical protein
MRLGVKPVVFLGRLLAWFVLTYAAWMQLAPAYTHFLAVLTQPLLSLVERATSLWAQGTNIFFWPRGMTPPPHTPSVPAEWIQANLVLLIPLMLATPAPTWATKARRCGLAFVLVLLWQILDVIVAIKYGYATQLDPMSYSGWQRYLYAFTANFVMFLDTQVVPFMIWAGVHFRQLLGTLVASKVPARGGVVAGRSTSAPGKPTRKLRDAKV